MYITHSGFKSRVIIVPIDRCSSYGKLKRVTAWILRFINNCLANKSGCSLQLSFLTTQELHSADVYWISVVQQDCFLKEIEAIKDHKVLHSSNPLTVTPQLLWYSTCGRQRLQQEGIIFKAASCHPLGLLPS